MTNIVEELKENNKPGIKRLWCIYNTNQRLLRSKYFWFSILFTVLVFVISIFNNIDIYNVLQNLVDKVLSIFPNILGFNIAGFVLLIGYIANKETKDLSEKVDEKYSLIQHKYSVFAFSLLVQSFTLLFAFIISEILSLELTCNCCCINPILINYFVFSIMLFGTTYSISLLIRIVLNVFDLGQTIHFFISVDKIEEKNKKELL